MANPAALPSPDVTTSSHRESALWGDGSAATAAPMDAILDGIPLLVAFVTSDERYGFVNAAYEEWFGIARERLLDRTLLDVIGPAAYTALRPFVLRALGGEKLSFEQHDVPYRLGGTRDIKVTFVPHRDAGGTVLGYVATLQDITEQRRLREESERRAHQRSEVLDAIRDGFLALDSAWRVVLVNPPFERMSGRSRGELLGGVWWDLFPSAAEPILPYESSYRRAMEQREDVSFSGQLSSGAWLEIRCSPTKDGGIAVFCRDVSDQRRADATMARQALELSRLLRNAQLASKRAEDANRTKDEFLATASHELRTPLNAILGWAQLLRLGQLDASSAQRASETIERNARAQVRLIEDILDGSRIITGKLQLEIRPLDLTALVRASLEAVRVAADAKQIQLALSLDPDPTVVTGDSGRLQQVVWNLVNNAIKFTPKGGAVSLSLRREGTHVELAVEDSGQGIEAAFLPHVFERFSQAEGSSTRRHGGLGLGLALVRHLIEAHGGTVSADSAGPGRGARFVVLLPVRAVFERLPESVRSSPVASPPSELPAISLAGITALVVDDEADSRELVAAVLRASGARVVAAGSAAAAIEALHESEPHVLISDVGMPETDGYTLIRQVRRLATGTIGAIPALALTAYSREQDRRKALEAGFQAHISKPVEPADLVRTVAILLERASTSSAETP